MKKCPVCENMANDGDAFCSVCRHAFPKNPTNNVPQNTGYGPGYGPGPGPGGMGYPGMPQQGRTLPWMTAALILSALLAVVVIAVAVVLIISKKNQEAADVSQQGVYGTQAQSETGEIPPAAEEYPAAEAESEPAPAQPAAEEETEVDADTILASINPHEVLNDIYERGMEFRGDTSQLISLMVLAGNFQTANWDKDGSTTLVMTQKNLKKLDIGGNGSCLIDEAREIYENDDYVVAVAPSFYRSTDFYEYSGILKVLFAKKPYEDYDYMPLYVELEHHEYKGIKKIRASSARKKHGAGNMNDYSPATCWMPQNDGDVLHESFTIDLAQYYSAGVHGIMILNGDRSSDNAFYRTGRVTQVKVDFGEGTEVTRSLDADSPFVESISAGRAVSTDIITVTILDYLPGTKEYGEAISEVYVY